MLTGVAIVLQGAVGLLAVNVPRVTIIRKLMLAA